MLIYNFGDWTEWNVPQKVTFIPEEKLISIHPGITQIDVQIDLYSAWKEWIRYYDNAKWAAAFTTFGGDPTGVNQYAPRYYFLTNGWKVYVENLAVVFQMNLYSDDGLSPFIINNAAVTNRASDVPIIKSELEQRLDYGDRVYYDETSSYVGTSYPNGTIAQPVNNPYDAIAIAQLYNINNFYSLSDINLPGIIGQTFQNYSLYADNENLTVTLYNNNVMNNIDWHGFIIDGNFYGGTNKFVDCIINNALDVSGQFKNCQINGNIRAWDSVVISSSYDGVASYDVPIFDMNSGRTTSMSIRSYSGGVKLINCDTSGCTAAVEITAGQVNLDSTCTAGNIDLCGVGYLINNSSGSTVKTLGLVGEFPLTSEDVAKLTGITSAIDDMTVAVESLDEKVSYISGTTYEMNENVLIMTSGFTEIEVSISGMTISISGMTESINSLDEKVSYISGTTYEMNENVIIMTSGFTDIIDSISGMTDSVNNMTVAVESLDEKVSYISGTTYEMNENVLIMTSGFTEIVDSISGITDSVNVMSDQVAGLDDQVKRILGLVQENFRIMNHTYSGDNLDSATVKIYNNGSDCDSDVNPLATYSMMALYDSQGKLVDYKVTKN